ncbi:hypothetical protein BC939DRAFT_458684 [Gamsiella multidivaricata]|uniref:uncharacterized protein n=1 Tax=Gamsiella multidivaricata TaxID=101098 RepID=UPI00221F0824|nr:uncharacterized protein BC939DRAFT_458684 [Gamsiella multidivaricata]KAI7820013.1 hypothetical protein BC939DRAFT_458684 [Gamsiella multidivaricata]
MMSNGDEVKKRPLDDLANLNSEPNGDASLPHDLPAHVPEETSLKRLKAEEDDHVPMSNTTAASTVLSSEQHPIVPSLDHGRPDFPAPTGHSSSDQTIDSDMSVLKSLPNVPATNVLSGPPASAPASEAAAPIAELRNPDSIDVSKPALNPPTLIAVPSITPINSSNAALASVNPILNGIRKPAMTREQLKYCGAIIKQLKRHRDAPAFLNPVDPVLLKIPDYPVVVKNPMDLSTVERKLNGLEYDTVDDFVKDVNLIFSNCYLYNGRESLVSICASNLEASFHSSLRHMPKDNAKIADAPIPKDTAKKTPAASKPKKDPVKKEEIKAVTPLSTPVSEYPPMDLSQSRAASEERRPKRDIHAPSKEIPSAIAVKKKGTGKWKSDPQLRYCGSILREFSKKANAEFMYPFMEPVDWVALNIPDYPKVIKNPMDISTVRKKLEEDEYDNAAMFEADVRLVLWNCFKFNPAGSLVHTMGRRMEKLFNEKWAERPSPPTPPPVVEEPTVESEEDDVDSSDEKIAEMERHLKTLSEKLKQMKAAKKKEKAEKKSAKASSQEKPAKSKTASKTPAKTPAKPAPVKASAPERKKVPIKRSRPVYTSESESSSEEDVPTITFEQKKELSDSINKFEGDKLANVVQIIHNSMPHLRDNGGQEEIELDMDSLDPRTLYKLYQYVKKNTTVKRKKPAPKKVKVQYSEEDATKKITELERTLQKFEQPAAHQKGMYRIVLMASFFVARERPSEALLLIVMHLFSFGYQALISLRMMGIPPVRVEAPAPLDPRLIREATATETNIDCPLAHAHIVLCFCRYIISLGPCDYTSAFRMVSCL